jgi:hypothetical protein
MQFDWVPAALHTRLGDEATTALIQLLDRSHREARQDLISACTERFDRRLVEEASGLRIQIAQLGAELRQEMAAKGAELRQEMTAMRADLRQEMAAMGADLRNEIAAMGGDVRKEMAAMGSDLRKEIAWMGGDLRQEIAAGRVDLFKWCFIFWIGQVVTISTAVGVMLRLMR